MTTNQIAYWNLKETERSNLAREGETYRSNLAKERETYRSNTARERETERANKAVEGLRFSELLETQRSNVAKEQENRRHNIQNEYIEGTKVGETVRHNKETESQARVDHIERQRHNLQTEKVAKEQLTSQKALNEASIYEHIQSGELKDKQTDLQVWDRINDTISSIGSFARGVSAAAGQVAKGFASGLSSVTIFQ